MRTVCILTLLGVAILRGDAGIARAGASANTWTCSVGDRSRGCTSSTLAPLPVPSTGLAAVAGIDGRIYAIGGYNRASGYLRTLQVYTPWTNTWSIAAPRPTAIASGAAAVGFDGRIYAFGGCNALCPSNIAEVYSPWTNTWATLPPMPTARYFLAAATGSDGRIYAIGGHTGSDNSVVEAYSPRTNTWESVAPMPIGLQGHAGATGKDGHIYVMGGWVPYTYTDTMEAYSPGTKSWTVEASMPTPRNSLAAATGIDGRIYAIGGFNRTSPDTNTIYSLSATEAYSTQTRTWVQLAPMPTARSLLAAVPDRFGRVYALGGSISDNSTGLDTVEAYSIR